jgi:hypothetical protein
LVVADINEARELADRDVRGLMRGLEAGTPSCPENDTVWAEVTAIAARPRRSPR